MGRRPGALAPGVVLYLIGHRGLATAELRKVLYQRSGLLGLSGLSNEMSELIASDALVFTGGIGEHAPEIRKRVLAGLDWLGLDLNAIANAAGECRISPDGSRVSAFMIPTDEESVLARGAEHVLQAPRGGGG